MSGIEAMSERQIQNLRRMRDRLLPLAERGDVCYDSPA
jgi:hypothetical protein